MTLRIAFLALVLALVTPPMAAGQVVNGAFEDPDEAGWIDDLPVGGWTATFPDSGGVTGGCARIASPTPDGEDYGCLSQLFSCGEPGSDAVCLISVTYRHANLGAAPRTGGVTIRLDGTTILTTDPEEIQAGWRTAAVTVPAGTHTLALCLYRLDGPDLDGAPSLRRDIGGIEGWEAYFDDVTAIVTPSSPTRTTTWGKLKWQFSGS
ncbi:MAG TPA: hypothetical protein VF720_04170 [Candidatus Eisenbacteria bacterium]